MISTGLVGSHARAGAAVSVKPANALAMKQTFLNLFSMMLSPPSVNRPPEQPLRWYCRFGLPSSGRAKVIQGETDSGDKPQSVPAFSDAPTA
jgi:hypothetical protein